MIALLLALLASIAGFGFHGASASNSIHAALTVRHDAAPKPVPSPLTAHPLAG